MVLLVAESPILTVDDVVMDEDAVTASGLIRWIIV